MLSKFFTWVNNVITGWKNYFFPDPLIEALSKKRMDICNSCLPPNGHNVNGTCNLCGCPLKSKTRAPEEMCPLAKWRAHKF